MKREVERLWVRLLDADLMTEDDDRALAAGLQADPDLRQELCEDAELDGALAALMWTKATSEAFAQDFARHLSAESDAREFVSRIGQELRARGGSPARGHSPVRGGSPRLHGRRRAGRRALAAGVLLVAGVALAWGLRQRGSQPIVSTVPASEQRIPGVLNHRPPRFSPTAARDPATGEGSAATARARVFQDLRRIPAIQARTLRAWPATKEGMFTDNKTRFTCAGSQTFGMDTLVMGAVLENRSWIDEGWKVIDATFAHQQPDGSFGDTPQCLAQWLGALAFALDMLEESPLADHYQTRIAALSPRFHRATGALISPASFAFQRMKSTELPAAVALLSAGARFSDPEQTRRGMELLNMDLSKLPRLEADAIALHLARLHAVMAVLDDPRVEATAMRDGQRLATLVTASGDVQTRVSAVMQGCAEAPEECYVAPHVRRNVRWALGVFAVRFEPSAWPTVERLFGALRPKQKP